MRDTTPQTGRTSAPRTPPPPDRGYTLIEMLLVLLILGILATVVVIAVGGIRTDAAETSCDADRRALHVAAETYFADRGGVTIPATGAGADRYERTLVTTGLLRDVSPNHDLDASGAATAQAGGPC